MTDAESARASAVSAPPAPHPGEPAHEPQRPNLAAEWRPSWAVMGPGRGPNEIERVGAALVDAFAAAVDAFVAFGEALAAVAVPALERLRELPALDPALFEPENRPAPRTGPPPPPLDPRRRRRR